MSLWQKIKQDIEQRPGLGPFYGAVFAATIAATVTVVLFVLSPKSQPPPAVPASPASSSRQTVNSAPPVDRPVAGSSVTATPNRGLVGNAPEASSPSSGASASIIAHEEDQKVAPGWVVQLHAVSMRNGELHVDPDTIAGYTQTEPNFSFKSFRERMQGSQQVVYARASSKFSAQVSGTFGFGVHIVVVDKRAICSTTLSVDGKRLIDRIDRTFRSINTLATSSVDLTKGDHDIAFGCGCVDLYIDDQARDPADRNPLFGDYPERQIENETWSILVSHPGDLGPVPARPEDFVLPTVARH